MKSDIILQAISEADCIIVVKQGVSYTIVPLMLVGNDLTYLLKGSKYTLDITNPRYTFEKLN